MNERFSRLIIGLNKAGVVLLLVLSLAGIVFPIFLFRYGGNVSLIRYFEMHHTVMRLSGFLILLVSWKLYKRVGAAWNIVMVLLSIRIFQYILIHREQLLHPLFLAEVGCYFLLLLSRNYYVRKTDRYSLRRGFLIYMLFTIFIFFNAALSVFREKGAVSFLRCMEGTLGILFDLNNLAPSVYTPHTAYYSFLFWFSWICIFAGLIAVLTPYVSIKAQAQGEMERARGLVNLYGQNCSAYLALEKDKRYLFGKAVKGVAAYGIIGDIFVVLGDPICDPKDFGTFLSEVKTYCERNAYGLLFLNTTRMFLSRYQELGMGFVKCGEEPRFRLENYTLAGSAASKVRLNINHATKEGIAVREYDPRQKKNSALEKEMMEISKEWFSMKKSGELVFTMGSIGLDHPMDRRYFYAEDPTGRIQAFVVFLPFAGRDGYVADVTRYRVGAVRGVLEKINYEAMMTFKTEGVTWASLAAAPLARLEEETDVTAKLLRFIYEKMNHVYGFKALYQAKQKYNPSCWEPNYYVFYPPVFTPAMAYAIVRIQNPLGIRDFIKSLIHNAALGKANPR